MKKITKITKEMIEMIEMIETSDELKWRRISFEIIATCIKSIRYVIFIGFSYLCFSHVPLGKENFISSNKNMYLIYQDDFLSVLSMHKLPSEIAGKLTVHASPKTGEIKRIRGKFYTAVNFNVVNDSEYEIESAEILFKFLSKSHRVISGNIYTVDKVAPNTTVVITGTFEVPGDLMERWSKQILPNFGRVILAKTK